MMPTMTTPRARTLKALAITACGIAALATVDHFLRRPATISTAPRPGPIPLCITPPFGTCLVDGDTGYEGGRKWRLISIDTPEPRQFQCQEEKRLGHAATLRLQALMASGNRLVPIGKLDPGKRVLLDVKLADGRDAGQVLLAEKLAQPWPNTGNIWCGMK
jgi:micrococcal nuclease